MSMFLQDDAPKARPADSFAPPTAEEKRIADALYDHTPAPKSSELYPIETSLRPTLDQNLTKLGDTLGMTRAQQAAERTEFAAVIREANLDPGVGRLIHDQWTSARLAPESDALDLRALNEETRRALRLQWGEKNAGDLLLRAEKVARQHPKLGAILRTGGIGSRGDVVAALVEHVRRVNFR